ncbi:B-cell receptor CD22-like [Ptychodera flava]|uniref:B-cell receptor CD22-like n=1 Tax=Ptychodera flava TaxID=63121 RepID=UPI00396A7F12
MVNVSVDVQYSPEIIMFDNVTYVIEGKEFIIVCKVSGNPTPDVKWKYNGNQVSQNETLQYGDIRRHQSGEYTCEANNTFWNNEIAMEDEAFYLNVQYPPTIDVTQLLIRKEYESVTFTCDAIDANPMNTMFTWLSIDGKMTPGAKLNLYNVTRDRTGEYECIGNNTYHNGEQGTGSNTTYFDVQYGPEVVIQESNIKIKEGAGMTLTCEVDSNPPVDSHSWTNNGLTISSNLSYSVEMVNRNDTGVYNCTAKTTFYNEDVDTGYDTTYVVVEYLPNVGIVGPSAAAEEGITRVTVTCTATDGLPDPTSLALLHVNETVNQVDRIENQDGVTNNTFDLGVMQRWNNGSYYCEANSKFVDKSVESAISTKIPIIVHYKPSISGQDNETMDVTIGSPASLICRADAYPDANVTWKKDGEKLNVEEDSSTYTIASVVEDDGGKYICIAENYLGKDQREIQLNVILSQGRTDIPLIAGISAGILLLLIVIIVLAVMIKRQKKPDKKKTEASEMSPLHFQQTPQPLEIHENPDVANNDTGDTGKKRKSNMYTDAPMSTFKTESDQNNVGGGGGSDDLDDIAVLYAQPNRKSLHQSADSGNKNHVPFDAEPGEYDPPQEPPRRYKEDNNVEGLTYADLDHAPGSGVTAPKKQPEGTTDYATVDFSRTAPQ